MTRAHQAAIALAKYDCANTQGGHRLFRHMLAHIRVNALACLNGAKKGDAYQGQIERTNTLAMYRHAMERNVEAVHSEEVVCNINYRKLTPWAICSASSNNTRRSEFYACRING